MRSMIAARSASAAKSGVTPMDSSSRSSPPTTISYHFERGDDTVFDPRTTGGGRTTYGALTAGVMIKPPKPALITDLMIRPELRYDRSLNGTHPFNDSFDQDMFTAAVDFVVMF